MITLLLEYFDILWNSVSQSFFG